MPFSRLIEVLYLRGENCLQNAYFYKQKGPCLKTPLIGARKSTQTFFGQSFSRTLRVMDVRTKNRGRPHRKVRFPAAPVAGRNFLTPGHPGVRVRNVRRKFGPKSLCLYCFFFPDLNWTGSVFPLLRCESLSFPSILLALGFLFFTNFCCTVRQSTFKPIDGTQPCA